jgi:PAS domain S-box-containing protein
MRYNKEEIRKKYSDLFKFSLDLIFTIDINGTFLDANEVSLNTLGYKREDIRNLSFENLLEKNDLKKAYELKSELIRTGKQSKPSDFKIKSKNGSYLYVEAYGLPLEKNGEIFAILGIAKNVTAHRKALKKMKVSEEMFRAIYMEGPVPAYTWQRVQDDFVLIGYNNAADKFTLGTVKHFLGSKATEMYRDRRDIIEDLQKCWNDKVNISRDMKYKFHTSKEEKDLIATYINVKPDLIIVHTKDITDQKKAQAAYYSLVENSLQGLIIMVPFRIIYTNEAFARISGYEVYELLNFSQEQLSSLIHPEDREVVWDRLTERMKDNDTPSHFEFRGIRKDGDVIWIEMYVAPIEFIGTRAIQATLIDISRRKVTEVKLIESENKYRHLYEDAPFSITLINSEGMIVDCNPTTETVLGYKKEEFIGKKFKDLPVIHPKYLPTLLKLFKRFTSGEDVHRIDIELYNKSGDLIWANLRGSLINLDGKDYVQAILIDITTRKKAEFLINEEIKKLKELDKIRKNIISRASHELKTPLVSICGGTELLFKKYKNKLKQEELEIVEIIKRGGERLTKLVESLTDVSTLYYNKFELNEQSNDLCVVIKECSKEMMPLAKKRKVNVDLVLPDSLFLKIDRFRIEQLMINLLSNAIKNTKSNGNIKILLKTIEDWAEISVIDTGIGFTQQELGMLFTRFGKVERYGAEYESIDIQGSGLGLYISKQIVDLHKGEIRAESEGRNKGSTFFVKLPIK